MLNVAMLSFVMLSVVAPIKGQVDRDVDETTSRKMVNRQKSKLVKKQDDKTESCQNIKKVKQQIDIMASCRNTT
jgi:hypothetical protein